ncbi:MAG: pyridoxal phosphate-dependent aminotransferase [Lachnospiraceae bacterium]|nr:pyridoxal phosphate-dependent aminotransferase [Lachnospiraceae bacterium]
MIAKQYLDMLGQKSVIREIFAYGSERAKEIGYENVFDYSLGNPSVPTPKEFSDKIIELLTEEDPVAIHGYSPSLGIPSVREAVAESLNKRFGMNYKMEHIFMTSAAASAIAHALRCVTVEGDEVVTFAPYFSEYVPYVNKTGAKLKVVPADTESFQINFEALDDLMNEKVMALLINTPNNPSGSVYSEETLKKLSAYLGEKEQEYSHPIYIISDEPYREIVFHGKTAPYVAKYYKNTLTCYSFSKSVSLPGERIGYLAIGPEAEGVEVLADMCGQISRGIGHNCPSSLIQLALPSVLYKTSDLSVYEKNKNILYKALTDMGFECVEPGGTFYMFPKSLEPDAKAFCEKGLKYDLLLVPGDGFECKGHFRMAYCIPTEKVERSLEAFEKLVKEYK